METYDLGSSVFEQGDEDDYVHYLIVGKLTMLAKEETSFVIDADSNQACYPLSQVQPRQYSARAIRATKVMRVSKSLLAGTFYGRQSTGHRLIRTHGAIPDRSSATVRCGPRFR